MKLNIPVSCELETLAKKFYVNGEILLITGAFVQQNIEYYLNGTSFQTKNISLLTTARGGKIGNLLTEYGPIRHNDGIWEFTCAETTCYLHTDVCIRLYPDHFTLEHYANDDFVAYGILDHEIGHLI